MEKSKSCPYYGKFEVETEDYENKRSSSKAYNFNGPSNKIGSSSSFSGNNDPESKRKRRVASYNMFSVEGKVKSSVKSSFKWIKNKFSDLSYDGYED
ncbi:hypothetical protein BVRB_1g012130 [Beta vulgaris subsp. vulgaris]|nr:hypothetical protein BVRB_1g012130 [Beta vulgaris subsp. vulgaris]